MFSLQFVLVEEGLEVWVRTAVYTERFVVRTGGYTLGPEHNVLKEDTWAWVVLPVEGCVGVAITFHFFLSKVFQ
jgi:hypothetical protein